MIDPKRMACDKLRAKIKTAEEAAALVVPGSTVGMSGFTGSGYPKAVTSALAKLAEKATAEGKPYKLRVLTGASTGPELDGALGKANAMAYRMPYNSDGAVRDRINKGECEYFDLHLSHVANVVMQGSVGKVDTAVIEVAGIKEDGSLIPSTSVGVNNAYMNEARQIILEVNSWQNPELEGMHDIFSAGKPPHRKPIPISKPGDRCGSPYFTIDPSKIAAIVETDHQDRNAPFSEPDDAASAIAGHIMDFFAHEVKKGRLPENLLPLQSGVGNIANAVLIGLLKSPFENLTSYTEVVQDGMVDLLDAGKLAFASGTAFSLSPKCAARLNAGMGDLRNKIVLRPQEISNHPEVIRRLGTLTMNGLIEADIYGNVNSTHVMGSRIQNGIGGSGDFTRNAYISIFMTPSTAKGGAISCIVPQVCHVDHIMQDVQVIVTEQGLADLRCCSPKQRAETVINNCAHPDFRPALTEYYKKALSTSYGKHTPVILDEALSWHSRFVKTGSMRA